MMITIREFKYLDADTLYSIMQLRMEVFYLEQRIMEQDFDDIDRKSKQIYIEGKGKKVDGCCRLFADPEIPGRMVIGRLAVKKSLRRKSRGSFLLKSAVSQAQRDGAKEVMLHAQIQTVDFYRRRGFEPIGEPYEEAGILHVMMIHKF